MDLLEISKTCSIVGHVQLHSNFLDIFAPLFEVTQNPSSNLRLHSILQHISGFDSGCRVMTGTYTSSG